MYNRSPRPRQVRAAPCSRHVIMQNQDGSKFDFAIRNLTLDRFRGTRLVFCAADSKFFRRCHMAQEQAKVHPIKEAAQKAAQPTSQTSQQAARPVKSKPIQALPADRIVFPKQLSLLRAYAAASGH